MAKSLFAAASPERAGKQKGDVSDLEFLHNAMVGLIELPLEEDIYSYAAGKLKEIAGDSIVVVCSFDMEKRCAIVRKILGLGAKVKAASRILGFRIIGASFGVPAEGIRAMSKGRLRRVPGGIAGLSPRIPKRAVPALQKLFGVEEIYNTGLVRHGEFYGLVSIMKKPGTELNFGLIQTLVAQVSVALQNRIAWQALRDEEARMTTIFDNIADVVAYIDGGGTLVKVSGSVERIFGYKPEKLEGRKFSSLPIFSGTSLKDSLRIFKGIFSGKTGPFLNLPIRHKDGHIIPIEANVTLVKENGAIKELVVVVRDVTVRRKAEEEATLHTKDLEFLSRTALELIELPHAENIYAFVGERLRNICGDPIIAVMENDEKAGTSRLRALLGAGKNINRAIGILGRDPLKSTFKNPDSVKKNVLSGRLFRVKGGLEGFHPALPRKVGAALARLLCLDEVYMMGFVRQNRLIGSAIILPRKGENIRAALVEAFIAQASVAIPRKTADDALRDSEERLRILFDNAPDTIYLHDLKGNLIDCNKAGEKMTGYSRKDFAGRTLLKPGFLISGEQVPLLKTELAKLALGRPAGPVEIDLRRKDGSIVAAELRSFPITVSGGNIVLGIARDITAKRASERALQESQKKLSAVFENTSDGIMVFDSLGKILDTNNAVFRMFGFTNWELVGKSFAKAGFFGPKGISSMRALFGRIVAGESLGLVELSVIHKDGHKVPVEAGIGFIKDGGKADMIVAAFRDLTERNKAEEALRKAYSELQEADAVKTRFLTTTSHELKTPITAMSAQAQLLDEGSLGEITGLQRQSVSILLRNIAALDILISDILDFSKIQSNWLRISPNEYLPEDCLIDMRETMAPLAKEKGIKLRVKAGSLPPVCVDRYRLCQVMRNLIDNAIKFTPRGGTITIGAERKGDAILVFVKDTGIGIAKKHLDRVFEPFYQAEPSYLKGRRGTGLGLPICKGIVEMHGGTIGVKSRPGKGSTFLFTIPLKRVCQKKDAAGKAGLRRLIKDMFKIKKGEIK